MNPSITKTYIDVFPSLPHRAECIPLMAMQSERKGPRVFCIGTIHGTEPVGTDVIHRVFREVRLKRGTIYAIPTANRGGSEIGSRFVPLSEMPNWENLNRVFPGNPKGSPAERVAAKIYTTIVRTRPQIVIDIHADSFHSISIVILDRVIKGARPQTKLSERTERFGALFGLTTCNETPAREYLDDKTDHTLTGALLNDAHIPAFVVELGGQTLADRTYSTIGITGIKNILKDLDMLDEPWEHREHPTKIHSDYPLRLISLFAKHKVGKLSAKVDPGDRVRKGQVIATIDNDFGDPIERISAPRNGYMVSFQYHPVVFPGIALGGMAVRDYTT